MKAIYEPKGKAAEYSPLACNLYQGCRHGCRYCYVPRILRKTPEEFLANYGPRPGILEALKRDCDRMVKAGDDRYVLFCFTSDPYQFHYGNETTRDALLIASTRGINTSILTKGGMAAERDFDIMQLGLVQGDVRFGTTLTCQDPDDSLLWEPNAAPPDNRKQAIQAAHDRGVFTWVSLEPVLYPEDSLSFIPELADYVDYWHVGKLNYHPHAKALEAANPNVWEDFTEKAWQALVDVGASFRFKDSLAEYLKDGREQQRMTMDEAAAAVAANQEGVK